MFEDRKLVRVEQGNVVLRVPEDDVQRYIDQGFNLIDEMGNVVKASIPRNVGALQKAYIEHTQEIESLKGQIEKLQKQLSTAKKKAQKTE